MEPIKLDFPPGLARNGTSYSTAIGRFYDANLVRWFEKTIRPMRGWAAAFVDTVTGNARAAHGWYDNDGNPYMAIATHSHLYVWDGSVLDDITPAGFTPGDADASTWTLDNFGELLIACNDSEQVIYEWQPGGGSDATAVTNAPSALAIFVTEERFIVALGANGDPRAVAWCDQENRTVWTASATNQAGDLKLQTPGLVMCGGKVRGGGLIWTNEDVHLMRYIGLPDVYGIERVASDCGIVGRHAFHAVDSTANWVGKNAFWRYAGYVEPIPSDISDDVFSNLNATHRHKVWCRFDPQFGEVWWHYPRGSATECSHYAILNTREGHWNHGAMARLCGIGPGVFDLPMLVDASGAVIKHEYGWDYDGASVFAVTGPLEIGNGGRRLQIDDIVPDEATQGDCAIYFHMREHPQATETTLGPYAASDIVGVIATARQVRFELRAADGTENFRIGTYRANVKPRGRY